MPSTLAQSERLRVESEGPFDPTAKWVPGAADNRYMIGLIKV